MLEAIVVLVIAVAALVQVLRRRGARHPTPCKARTAGPARLPPLDESAPTLVSEDCPTGGASLESFRLLPLPQAPPTARPPLSPTAAAAWVPRNAPVTVAGTVLPGGMIYVGRQPLTTDRYGAGRWFIDPSLKVASSVRAGDLLHVDYYPDYASLTPAVRRAYLDWHAGGRSDPAIAIGFVYLFFYGLERRLFLERQLSEAPELVAEIRRLLAIHGDHSAFRTHATAFLAAAALATSAEPARIEPHPIAEYFYEMPLATRVRLGAMLASGQPLAADDALLWVLGVPETRLRTPGQRCFPELRQLFAQRFAARHPSGLAVRKPKRRLTATYRAASGDFTADIPGVHQTFPDIAAVLAPVPGLQAMLDACQTELEPYSRLLGRKPGARGSLEAALVLPASLQLAATSAALAPVRARLVGLLPEDGFATVPTHTLIEALGLPPVSATKVPIAALAQAELRLDALDFGVEPDRRYGGGALAADAEVVLFRAERGSPVDPDRLGFVAAKAAIEVAMLAALADGTLTAAELIVLRSGARAMRGLEPAEHVRLEALVLRGRARAGTALKRASPLPEEARRAIAAAAVAATLADGNASPREIEFLERIHRTLGLPVEAVHAALHQGTAPLRSGAGDPRILLDTSRLERIRAETASVSSLLSDIFAEDSPAPVASPATPHVAMPFEGLDLAHGTVLARLVAAGRLDAGAFARTAEAHGLLPDGAAETINDWAFDRFGEVLLETDTGGVAIMDHLAGALAPAGESP